MTARELIKLLANHPDAQVYFEDQYGEPGDLFDIFDIRVNRRANKLVYLVARKGVGEEYLD